MLSVKVICTGKLKEKFYTDASAEYCKRLSAYCKTEVIELPEVRRSASPSPAEIEAAMKKEAAAILREIPKGAFVIPMCIEGKSMDSVSFSELLQQGAAAGGGRICFVIGGSDGLHESVKELGAIRLSMSKMTFPHHLARVMLLEQIYRGLNLAQGGKYHK